jgi:hypothetical protein
MQTRNLRCCQIFAHKRTDPVKFYLYPMFLFCPGRYSADIPMLLSSIRKAYLFNVSLIQPQPTISTEC